MLDGRATGYLCVSAGVEKQEGLPKYNFVVPTPMILQLFFAILRRLSNLRQYLVFISYFPCA